MTSAEGGSSFKIADAYVLVGGKLDDRSVEQTVTKAQQQVDRSSLTLQVKLDKKSVNAATSEARTSVKELDKDFKISLGVGLDGKSLAATELDVMAKADELGRKAKISLNVDLDKVSVAKTEADLKATTKIMGRADGVQLKVSTDGFDKAQTEIQQFDSSFSQMAKMVAAGVAVGAGSVEALGLAAWAGGFAALAIAAESSTKEVQQAFSSTSTSIRTAAQQAFTPIIPALTAVLAQTSSMVQGLRPEMSRIAVALAPALETVGTGLNAAIKNAVQDSVPILEKLPPLATAIGSSFTSLEHGLSGFAANIDVKTASSSWTSLTDAIAKILPPLSLVLNAIAPLGNALINILGNGLNVVLREVASLEPVLKILGSALGAIGPVIAFMAPPLLAAGAASKILTGSWTDLEGAGKKVKAAVTDLPSKFQSLGQALGYTSASAKQAAVDKANLALVDANLAKEVDELALKEAVQTAQQSGMAKDALAVSESRKQLKVSTEAAKEAEVAFNEASSVSTFSLGPLAGILGAVGLAAAMFAGQAHDAGTQTQDLSQQIIQLGQAAPDAAGNIAAGSPDLQKLSDQLRNTGNSVQEFSKSYSSGSTTAQQYTDSLVAQQEALGNQQSSITHLVTDSETGNSAVEKLTVSTKDLADMVKSGVVAMENLSPAQQAAVNKYNDLNSVIPQAKNALANFNAQQQATIDALRAQGISLSSTQQAWNSFGNSISSKVSAFNSMTSGIKSMTDNTLAADQAALQAKQNFVQLDAALTQAGNGYVQAQQATANAAHGIMTAAQGVADARHSEAQSAIGVQNAQQSYGKSVLSANQAQLAYTNSIRAEENSERSLTIARQQATIALQNEQRQVLDASNTQAEAQIRLFDAQRSVHNAGLDNTTMSVADIGVQGKLTSATEGRYQLLLQLSEAQNNLNNVTAAGQQLTAQNTVDQAAGVNGSTQMITAQQSLASAQQQVSQSSDSLLSAQNAIQNSAQGVTDALYAQRQAHLATENAVYQENQASIALRQAKQNESLAAVALTNAKQADTRSTDLNTIQGVQNYQMIETLFEKNFAATGSIQDATTATEVQGQQMGITAGQVDQVINSVTGLNGKTAIFGVVGQPSVDISQIVAAAVQQGINPESLGFSQPQVQAALGPQVHPTGRMYARSQGGQIRGPGTTTSDSILAMSNSGPVALSDKEFVVNAHDTQRTLPLLEHINRGGSVPGLASGGQLGKAIMGANLRLAAWDAGVQAFSNTYSSLGYKGMPRLPASNPPTPSFSGLSGSGNNRPATGGSVATAQAYARSQFGRYGWGSEQMSPLIALWNQESGWNPYAVNPSSGAAGIAQSLGHGHVTLGDYVGQIDWGEGYIAGRYGSPARAWAHEIANNWYDHGGLLPQGLSLALNNTGANEHKAVFTQEQWSDLHKIANSGGSGEVHYHAHTTVIAQGNDDAHSIAMKASADAQWKILTMVRQ